VGVVLCSGPYPHPHPTPAASGVQCHPPPPPKPPFHGTLLPARGHIHCGLRLASNPWAGAGPRKRRKLACRHLRRKCSIFAPSACNPVLRQNSLLLSPSRPIHKQSPAQAIATATRYMCVPLLPAAAHAHLNTPLRDRNHDVPPTGRSNYLGLSDNREVIEAAKAALDTHGNGLSSVRFICGKPVSGCHGHHLPASRSLALCSRPLPLPCLAPPLPFLFPSTHTPPFSLSLDPTPLAHAIIGTQDIHKHLERQIAEFHGMEVCAQTSPGMLFVAGSGCAVVWHRRILPCAIDGSGVCFPTPCSGYIATLSDVCVGCDVGTHGRCYTHV